MNDYQISIVDKNNKQLEEKLSNVLFSENNPRFSRITDININFIDFLNQENRSQEEVIQTLISCEGDFSDLLDLINSINDRGFIDRESIWIVKNSKNNKYTVAEGNRRLLCLKLLLKVINLPDYCELTNIENNYSNEKSFYQDEKDWNDNINTEKKKFENYEEIKKIISKSDFTKKYKKITFYLIEKDDELWNIIYDKHLSGDKVGIRKWSRAKYFADLIQWFGKTGFKKDSKESEDILNKINRNPKDIENDFKEAQFIYACFYFGLGEHDEGYKENEICYLNHDDILDKICFSDRISALERTHSFNKVRLLLMKYLKIDDVQKFEDIYLKITFDDRNMIKFIDKKFICRKLLNFLFKKWKQKEITTRPFKDEDKILHEVWWILNNININTKLTSDQLDDLDEFNCTIDEINKILKVNESENNNNDIKFHLERFKYAKNIKLNCNKLIESFKKKNYKSNFDDYSPISVFQKLIDQLNWNLQNREKYLNAVCVSLRAFWEQFIIWCDICLETDLNEQDKYITSFIKNRTMDLKNKIINKLNDQGSVDDNKIINYLNCVGINNENSNFYEQFKSFLHDYLANIPGCYNIKRNILNEGIHSLHRIYLKNDYIDNLKVIDEMCNLTNNFIKEIDLNTFKVLNQKIISKLSESN